MSKFVSRFPVFSGVLFVIFTFLGKSHAAVFLPDPDRTVLTIGQDVDSVNSYTAAVGVPGGIMSYTSTAYAEGLTSLINYGAGNINAQVFAGAAFTNTILQLGVYIDDDLANIVAGQRDANIAAIGNWIKSAARPVYLRIGYEFDGPWNALPPDQYIAAYRYIVNAMRANSVTNAIFVWHSCCAPTFNGFPVSAWYPGDDYVDWAGISVYQQFDGTLGTVADIDNFCAFAKAHNKPIMIAESTPYGGISDARWANWFLPCLELIHRHHIQMWSYIDCNWDAQSMFAGQGWGDCRIEQNAFVLSNWLATISSPAFLKQSPELYPRLHAHATNEWHEAESAQFNGASIHADVSASGGNAVSLSAPGQSITFTNSGTAQQFIVRYAAENSGTLGLYVNSQPRRSLPLASTGGAYRDLLVHALIPPGSRVTLEFDAGDVPANLDALLFHGEEDSDGDGLPDDWERWHFGTLAYGPNDDPDGDGSCNYAEWVADTDPANSASVLRITSVCSQAGTAALTMSGSGSRDCAVQQSTDLRKWTFPSATIQNTGAAANVALGNSQPKSLFFRLVVP